MKQIDARIFTTVLFLGLCLGFLFPVKAAAGPCQQWAGELVSLQGIVETRGNGQTRWLPAILEDTFCPGDSIRIGPNSRAAVRLPNDTILKLDELTTVTFSKKDKEKRALLDILKGAVYFFDHHPTRLKVITPFVNAAIEGTEFFIKVEKTQTFLSIFEGRVAATNEFGRITLAKGQSAVARAGQTPVARVVARPRDAVQWALYYPPVLDYQANDFAGGDDTGWRSKTRKSIEFYWKGDLANAFTSLEGAPEDIDDPHFFIYRAGLLLTVGRVDEAESDIKKALDLDPQLSEAAALESIIATAQNEEERALALAASAVSIDEKSAVAHTAMSYACQARFDLEGALDSARQAVKLDGENALAWSRLSELWLSTGDLKKALTAAKAAVIFNPNLARTQTVLGFAHLTQIKISDALNAFQTAIKLDPAAPLPRLGLGLAKIRKGNLTDGRREIEIAAGLDPGNALIRSYLGKAYFEEKRDDHAANQLAVAKELDPNDPTPWFYDAIRKQSINRPVEALHDLQKSIELNDNRAVYRSRLMLDEDLAARSASLGRIYRDLGFEQLALVEGWKSVNTDPANYSAHRLLADSYAALSHHDIARVSELLQSQLLQPINLTPIQPQLAESQLGILDGAGPSAPSFNEFTPLFNRNRLSLQANGVAGGNDTLGNDLVLSGLYGINSFSFGQFHYGTDGFRENNDQDKDLYNVFYQVSPWYHTSILAEFRSVKSKFGDLPLRFDPELFSTDERHIEESDSLRLGMRHAFSPQSDIIATVKFKDTDSGVANDFVNWTVATEGYHGEAQHLFHSRNLDLITGFSHYNTDEEVTLIFAPDPPVTTKDEVRHTNIYLYSLIAFPKNIIWTIGGSGDFFEGDENKNQFNPKLGFSWDLFPSTTLRVAAFSTLGKSFIADQTIEPTQVAGFNQFFRDLQLDDIWRYGAAVDHTFSERLFSGIELSKRDVETSYIDFDINRQWVDWEEELARVYINWVPLNWLSINMEYQLERLERPLEHTGEEQVLKLETQKIPIGVKTFCPYGITTEIKTTYVDQDGVFDYNDGIDPEDGSDRFWTTDVSLSYRLPKRYGILSIEAKNIFDEDFQCQSMDKARPEIAPDRLILFKLLLSF